MSARPFGAMPPRCFHAIDNFSLLLTQHLSVPSNHAEKLLYEWKPRSFVPKPAHAANDTFMCCVQVLIPIRLVVTSRLLIRFKLKVFGLDHTGFGLPESVVAPNAPGNLEEPVIENSA